MIDEQQTVKTVTFKYPFQSLFFVKTIIEILFVRLEFKQVTDYIVNTPFSLKMPIQWISELIELVSVAEQIYRSVGVFDQVLHFSF